MSDVEVTDALAAKVSGPAVYAMLDSEQREEFAAEFRAALVGVTRSFDLDPLASLIRQWWVTAGGDPAAAEADRDVAEQRRNFVVRPEFNSYGQTVTVPITGPDVAANLDPVDLVGFEEEWHELVIGVAEDFDIAPLRQAIRLHWIDAMDHANPAAAARKEAAIAAATATIERGDFSGLYDPTE